MSVGSLLAQIREKIAVWWKGLRASFRETDLVGRILLLAIPAAILLFLLNFTVAWARDNEAAGQFGDSFGVATSLFSGAAFAMLVVSIWLQRKELEIVREERNDTRKIFAEQQALTSAQKKAFDEQIETARDKTREDQFYSLVGLISNEIQRVDATKGPSQKSALIKAHSVALQLAEPKGDLDWNGAKVAGGNADIYLCMAVCKLFGAAWSASENLSPQRRSYAREVLRAMVSDELVLVYACIVKLRGFDKENMTKAFHELRLSDVVLSRTAQKISQVFHH